MPYRDLVTLIGDLSHWGPHEENTATLLDVLYHGHDLSWADRVTDPDEAEAERRQAKRSRISPPKHPIVPPVAARPPRVADRRMQEYVDALTPYLPPPPDPWELLAQWERSIGI
jgi:hypothetical protein